LLRRREDLVLGLLDLGEHLIGLFRDRSSLPYTFSISAKLVGAPSVYTITSEFHPSSVLADLDPRALGQFSETMSLSSSSGSFTSSSLSSEDSVPVSSNSSSSSSSSSSSTRSLGIWQTQFNGKRYEFRLNYPGVDIQLVPLFKQVNLHDVLYHRHPSSEIRIFSYLKRYGILKEFTAEMAEAFPGVSEIDVVPYPDGTQGPVYVEMGDRRLPLFVFGDGMRRWFYLLGHMLVSKNGVHCIEEIDFAFHPAAQRDLSRLLIRYAEQYENQLFLTSHSIEFADIFLDALYGEDGVLTASSEDTVRVFTIKPSEDQKDLDIWKLTGREAYKNRSYYELELR
jgi:hypothetical protein